MTPPRAGRSSFWASHPLPVGLAPLRFARGVDLHDVRPAAIDPFAHQLVFGDDRVDRLLRRLDEQIGKRIDLTAAGEALDSACGGWLETSGRFEQTIADLKGVKQRRRIATVTTTKYFMPRLLGPFCSAYPGIDIALEVVNRDRVSERLARNPDDPCVMGVPPDDLDSVREPFWKTPWPCWPRQTIR